MAENDRSYQRLFEPGQIGGLSLRNRVIMGMYPSGFAQESQVSDRLLWFYRTRARGGTAMIVVEGPSINYPRDYRGGSQLRLDEDVFLPGLRRLTEAIHAEGAKAFIQLNHPAVLGTGTSMVSLVEKATTEELKALTGRFGQAASRAQEAGFDGVEVQAAWGQLSSRLLSPASNHRTDAYGGHLDNRARFLLEAVASVKETVGAAFPVQVKLAARDYEPGGFDLEEAQAVAIMLEKAGVDSILVSAGVGGKSRRWGLPPQAAPDGLIAPLAEAIRKVVGIPVIAVGKIRHPDLAEDILAKGQADFISLTRTLIADPDWPNKAAEGNAEGIRGCIACLHDCISTPVLGKACTVNPYAGQEGQITIEPAERKKRVIVVGGGPAGLQAAITSAERGHSVHLYEQSSILGGPFGLPIIQNYKGDVAELPKYLVHRARQVGIEISMETRAEADGILAESPDAVVIAAGVTLITPPIPGIDQIKTVQARSLWTEAQEITGKVAIIGGGSVGCETAELLTNSGCKVTVLEMMPDVLQDMTAVPKDELLTRLKEKGVTILTGVKVTKLGPDHLVYQDGENAEHTIPIDTLVLAVGGRPNRKLADELQGKIAEVYVAGDCDQPGNGGMAIRDGLAVGLKI